MAVLTKVEQTYHLDSLSVPVIKAADDSIFLKDGKVHGIRRKGQEDAP